MTARSIDLHDLIGGVGVLLILVSYLLVQLRRMRSPGLAYSALNAGGATLILFSLTVDFNLSAFTIELFWLLISLLGVMLALARRRG